MNKIMHLPTFGRCVYTFIYRPLRGEAKLVAASAVERKRMGLLNLLSKIHEDDQPVASGGVKGPCATLREHGIDPAGLKFTLNQDGSVTVSGRARNAAACERILRVIGDMPLVERVRNHMTIDAAGPPAHAGFQKKCG